MRTFLFTVTGILVIVVAAYLIHNLRETAAANEETHRQVLAELACNAQVEDATEIVKDLLKDRTLPARITETKPHYNKALKVCIVQVSRREFGEGKESNTMLIDPKKRSALLWAVTSGPSDNERHCFSADAMPLDCAQADSRLKTYMTQ